MKYIVLAGILILALVMLTGCVAGPNGQTNTPNEDGHVAGFWLGLWHGVIAPITFVISLFKDNVSIYEVHNNGGWYNFGFLLGLTVIWGGGPGGAARARRRRNRTGADV